MAKPALRELALTLALQMLQEGTLSIDSTGAIWRHRERTRYGSRKIISRRAESPSGRGYLRVVLGVPKTRRTCSIQAHRLVWIWHKGHIPDQMQINHRDVNKKNNALSNLELVTGPQNIQHSYAHGRTRPWTHAEQWRGKPRITDERKQEVVRLRQAATSYKEIRAATGISDTQIGRICEQAGLARRRVQKGGRFA